jgi:hypothetical protein
MRFCILLALAACGSDDDSVIDADCPQAATAAARNA